MILLIHKNAEKVLKVIRNEREVSLETNDFCGILWELTGKFPDEMFYWVEEEFQNNI